MNNQDGTKRIVKEYLKENLNIEATKEGGQYGSKTYTKIEIKIGDETISTTYIDD